VRGGERWAEKRDGEVGLGLKYIYLMCG
jgi:hypothetical protein